MADIPTLTPFQVFAPRLSEDGWFRLVSAPNGWRDTFSFSLPKT